MISNSPWYGPALRTRTVPTWRWPETLAAPRGCPGCNEGTLAREEKSLRPQSRKELGKASGMN